MKRSWRALEGSRAAAGARNGASGRKLVMPEGMSLALLRLQGRSSHDETRSWDRHTLN